MWELFSGLISSVDFLRASGKIPGHYKQEALDEIPASAPVKAEPASQDHIPTPGITDSDEEESVATRVQTRKVRLLPLPMPCSVLIRDCALEDPSQSRTEARKYPSPKSKHNQEQI